MCAKKRLNVYLSVAKICRVPRLSNCLAQFIISNTCGNVAKL